MLLSKKDVTGVLMKSISRFIKEIAPVTYETSLSMLPSYTLQDLWQSYFVIILGSYHHIFELHARLVTSSAHVIKSLHSQPIMLKDKGPCFISGWTLTNLAQCFFPWCLFLMAIDKMLLSKAPSHYLLVGVTWLCFLMSGYEQVNTIINPIYAVCSQTYSHKNSPFENILQCNLFIILESLEMIAQLRICSILFPTVIVPMQWLASNTFKLAHRGWGEKSMGRVPDLLYTALV